MSNIRLVRTITIQKLVNNRACCVTREQRSWPKRIEFFKLLLFVFSEIAKTHDLHGFFLNEIITFHRNAGVKPNFRGFFSFKHRIFYINPFLIPKSFMHNPECTFNFIRRIQFIVFDFVFVNSIPKKSLVSSQSEVYSGPARGVMWGGGVTPPPLEFSIGKYDI